jgi:hypothetical protein
MEVWEQQYMKARRVGNPFGQDSRNVGKINRKILKRRTFKFVRNKLYITISVNFSRSYLAKLFSQKCGQSEKSNT